MLMPFQASGTQPPLFLVHDIHGEVAAVSSLARILGPDFPCYGIGANGVDGRQPVIDNMADMVRTYVEEICTARPTGPLRIGGVCEGGWAAIEVARALQEAGREVRPVLLLDPPAIPPGYYSQNRFVNHRHPPVAERLYQSVRHQLVKYAAYPNEHRPFDPGDPKQLHAAVLAGVGSVIAFCRYLPKAYSGPVALILSAQRAPRHFDPQTPGARLLSGPRLVLVLPWQHENFHVDAGRDIAHFLKYLLVESLDWETVTGRPDRSDQPMALASSS